MNAQENFWIQIGESVIGQTCCVYITNKLPVNPVINYDRGRKYICYNEFSFSANRRNIYGSVNVSLADMYDGPAKNSGYYANLPPKLNFITDLMRKTIHAIARGLVREKIWPAEQIIQAKKWAVPPIDPFGGGLIIIQTTKSRSIIKYAARDCDPITL